MIPAISTRLVLVFSAFVTFVVACVLCALLPLFTSGRHKQQQSAVDPGDDDYRPPPPRAGGPQDVFTARLYMGHVYFDKDEAEGGETKTEADPKASGGAGAASSLGMWLSAFGVSPAARRSLVSQVGVTSLASLLDFRDYHLQLMANATDADAAALLTAAAAVRRLGMGHPRHLIDEIRPGGLNGAIMSANENAERIVVGADALLEALGRKAPPPPPPAVVQETRETKHMMAMLGITVGGAEPAEAAPTVVAAVHAPALVRDYSGAGREVRV